MKVLVVDDEHLFIEFLVESLKERGFDDISFAHSGEEALQQVENSPEPFDCFLLDIKMPGMDGIQLCSEIRDNPEYRTAPIIMITSANATKYMQAAFDVGATDYLSKPIDVMELHGRMQVAMMLVETLSIEEESRKSLLTLLRMSSEEQVLDIGMRMTFSDVPCMHDYFELENKLHKLNDGLFNISLLAVEVSGMHSLATRLSQREFLAVVHSISRILGNALPRKGAMLSYVGYGKFICVVTGRNHIVPQLLKVRIREEFASFASRYWEVSLEELSIEAKAISSVRVLSPTLALDSLKGYIGDVGKSHDTILPPINESKHRLFAKIG